MFSKGGKSGEVPMVSLPAVTRPRSAASTEVAAAALEAAEVLAALLPPVEPQPARAAMPATAPKAATNSRLLMLIFMNPTFLP